MNYQIEPIVVTGYHGTSVEAAERILTEGFKPSQNQWEWLGHGVYFWQDAPLRAYEWGREWLKRRGYDGPIAVVAAEILLVDFMDLLDQQGMRLLRGLAADFQAMSTLPELRNQPPKNFLDCALFNFATTVLSLEGNEVSGWRAACVEGQQLTQDSPIYDLSHVQLVVLDHRVIRRKWILKENEKT